DEHLAGRLEDLAEFQAGGLQDLLVERRLVLDHRRLRHRADHTPGHLRRPGNHENGAVEASHPVLLAHTRLLVVRGIAKPNASILCHDVGLCHRTYASGAVSRSSGDGSVARRPTSSRTSRRSASRVYAPLLRTSAT